MEELTKQEQRNHFLKQYDSFIEKKNGIYVYPENIPQVLKEYLENINDSIKAFPQWCRKSEQVVEISEEELQKMIQALEEEDDLSKINFR